MNRVRRFPWSGLGSKFVVADILRGLATASPLHHTVKSAASLFGPRCQARPSQPQLCSPYSKAGGHQPFLCSAVVIPSSRPCTKPVLPRTGVVKDGAATAKGGLSLTAPSTVACWMPLGPRKFFDAARRALLLFGMDTAALPVWDEEDEAEQSEGRPYRCSYGRHKQRSDLTSSFVPRGTSSARGGGNQSLRFSI